MNRYNIPCPVCGTINRDIELQETDGWMECEKCHTVARVLSLKPLIVAPRDESEKTPLVWNNNIAVR